jgi:hypothetical protein
MIFFGVWKKKNIEESIICFVMMLLSVRDGVSF